LGTFQVVVLGLGWRERRTGTICICAIVVLGMSMSRLFISHSSKDNFEAIAFRDWLELEGWAPEEIFLDLHDIGAGARLKEALAKANERCEAVVLLASPDSLASTECRVGIPMAEDYGK
jgi:hypothetical protein